MRLADIFCYFKICLIGLISLVVPLRASAVESPDEMRLETADTVTFERGGDVEAHGNVSISWDERSLSAPLIRYNRKDNNILAPRGGRLVRRGGEELTAKKIRLNRTTGDVTLSGLESRTGSWFAGSPRVTGNIDRRLTLYEGSMTTCNLDAPHYRLTGSRFYFYPGDRLTGYNVVFWLGRVPVFYLPWMFVGLGDRLSRLELRPNYSSRDGFGLETRYHYLLPRDSLPFTASVYTSVSEHVRQAAGVDFSYRDNFSFSYLQSRRRPLVIDDAGNEVRAAGRKRVWKASSRLDYSLPESGWRLFSSASYTNYRRFDRDLSGHLAPRAVSKRYVKGGLNHRTDGSLTRLEVRREDRPEPGGDEIDNFRQVSGVMPDLSYTFFPRQDSYLPFQLNGGLDVSGTREFSRTEGRYLWSGRMEGSLTRSFFLSPLLRQSYRVDYGINYRDTLEPPEEEQTYGDVGFSFQNIAELRRNFLFELGYRVRQRTSEKSGAKFGEKLGFDTEYVEKHGREFNEVSVDLNYRSAPFYLALDGGYDLRASREVDVSSDSRILPVRLHGRVDLDDYWTWSQYLLYEPDFEGVSQVNTRWEFKPARQLNFELNWWYNRRHDSGPLSHLGSSFSWDIYPDEWKIRGNLTYNLESEENTDMRFLLDRNLHCWDMQLMYRKLSDSDRQVWVMFTLADFPSRGFGVERNVETGEVDLSGSVDRR